MPNQGTVTQVIGPVVDVSFDTDNSKLPEILNALTIEKEDGEIEKTYINSKV